MSNDTTCEAISVPETPPAFACMPLGIKPFNYCSVLRLTTLFNFLAFVVHHFDVAVDIELALAPIVVHVPDFAENRPLSPALHWCHVRVCNCAVTMLLTASALQGKETAHGKHTAPGCVQQQ